MLGHRKLSAEDYLAILKRRRVLILLPLLILPILTYGISFLIPAEYVSQALILVEEKKVSDDLVKSIISQGLGTRLATMRETALSRTRLEPIIQHYNLYPSRRLSMEDRIDLTRKAITILPIKSEMNRASGLPGFTIAYKGDDPRTAQQVCAEVTSLFVTQNLQIRQDAAVQTTDFFKKQLADAKAVLDDQDQKLAAFQSEHVMNLPGSETTTGTMLTSFSTQLDAANQALSRAQQDLEQYQTLLALQLQNAPLATSSTPGSLAAPTPQADQIELQSLLAQEAQLTSHYTDNYPDVVAVRRKIAEVRKKIAAAPAAAAANPASNIAPTRVETPEIMQLRAKVRASEVGVREKQREIAQIQRNINEYQGRLQASPLLQEKYKELSRGYETARKIYDDLLVKIQNSKEQTDLERGQQGEQFTVMDGANLPDEPTFPKRWIFATGGLVLGMAIGLGLAALLEYRDTVLRSEQDVWAFTRLPTLAVIAYSGALVVPQARPGMLARIKNLFSRKRPTGGFGDDELSKAST